jgi:hypothetical protein
MNLNPESSSGADQPRPQAWWEGLPGNVSLTLTVGEVEYKDLHEVFSRFIQLGGLEPYGCCGSFHCGQGAVPE